MPRGWRARRARGLLLVVELLHRAEHLDQQPLLIRRHRRRRLDLRQRLLDQRPALLAAEHLPADGLHHVLGQDAAHHRQLDVARRIVEKPERRLLAVAEERRPGRVAESLRDHDRDGGLPLLDRVARLVLGRRRDLQVLVGLRAGDDRLRDRAGVLVDDRDGDPRRLAVLAAAGKIAPKNDAMAIGTTKLTITERRSLKNSCRSLRTIARSGMTAISRASSFRSA